MDAAFKFKYVEYRLSVLWSAVCVAAAAATAVHLSQLSPCVSTRVLLASPTFLESYLISASHNTGQSS